MNSEIGLCLPPDRTINGELVSESVLSVLSNTSDLINTYLAVYEELCEQYNVDGRATH